MEKHIVKIQSAYNFSIEENYIQKLSSKCQQVISLSCFSFLVHFKTYLMSSCVNVHYNFSFFLQNIFMKKGEGFSEPDSAIRTLISAPSFAFGFLFSFVYDLTLSVGRTCTCNKRQKSIVSVGIWVCVLRKSLVFLDNIGYLYIIPCFYES